MKEEVLFEITKDNLETGLRGVPVGYCTTSHVDPQKGLFYVGRPIAQLSHWEPIQVIYLLYHGEEGSQAQVKEFEKKLEARAKLPESLIRHIHALPRSGHPMDLFCAAIQMMGMFQEEYDYREDTLKLIAQIPAVAAHVINYHGNFENTPKEKPDLGYVENFTHLLQAPCPDKKLLNQVLRLFTILHFDHGGGNLSTFIGKAVASSLQHLYGSLSSAMNALAGPRHGRANQDTLEFVERMLKELGENATLSEVEKFIRDCLARSEPIPGFGHAVLRVEDARATVFYDFAKKHFPQHPLVKMGFLLRAAGSKVLAENPKIADPHPNVDAMSGTLLTAGGFPYPEYYTVLFGMARCTGIAIQIIYERLEARGGKGTPIVRPKYLYKAR